MSLRGRRNDIDEAHVPLVESLAALLLKVDKDSLAKFIIGRFSLQIDPEQVRNESESNCCTVGFVFS